ncbi:jg25738, partial [Pararge aegeria aegeria]
DQSEDIKLDMKPIKEINRVLSILLSKEFVVINEENRQLKERTDSLVQHMEHYIEIIEIVEEVSAVLKLDDLKKSASIARELRESVALDSSPNVIISVPELNTIAEQKQIVQNLQEALTALNVEAFDCEQEFAPPISEDIRQQIVKVVSDIQNDLVALTSIFVVLENTGTLANVTPTDKSDLIIIKEEKPGNFIENEQYVIVDLEVKQEDSSQVLGADIDSKYAESEIIQIEQSQPTFEVSTTPCLGVSEDNKQSESELTIQEVGNQTGTENFVFKNHEEPVTEADTIEESLVQHINEYLCEDILMDIRKILPYENFNQLEQLALEVRDNAISKYTCLHQEYFKKQLERVLKLQHAMVEAYDKNLGDALDQTLQALTGKDSLQALKLVFRNLLKSLEMYVVLINTIPKTEREFVDDKVFIEETPKIEKVTNICTENIYDAEDPSIASLIEKRQPEEQNIDSDNINFEVQRNEMNVLSENITDIVVKNSKADMEELKKG